MRRRGHQCWQCRSDKISQALQLDPIEAVARARECGLVPLVPYPGSIDVPWKSRCTRCETILIPGPRLHNLRGGQGGCAVCAERGINPTLPGYLYLATHAQHRALKWGIANLEYRVAQHRSQGWLLVARWNFDLAGEAWEVERQIKAWVRQRGIPRALDAADMKYGGHTETARIIDISELDLLRYVEGLVRSAPDLVTDLALEVARQPAELQTSPPGPAKPESVEGLGRGPAR